MAVNLNPSFTRFSTSTVAPSTRICSPIKTQFANSQVRLFSPLIPALKLRATNTRISQARHFSLLIPAPELRAATTRRTSTICCLMDSILKESAEEDNVFNLQVLKRWDVPWNWQTISLTSLVCALSYTLPIMIAGAALYYFGIRISSSSDAISTAFFLTHGIVTTLVLTVLLRLTKSSSPLPDDIYRYDWREPFNLKKGWLLWAGIGLGVSVSAMAVTGAAMYFFNIPKREHEALMFFLPMIGSSNFSTACLVGCTALLGPVLEETFFRGFLMVFLTKWLPTPLSVLLSAVVYAVAQRNPGGFPLLLVYGTVMGFSYAQTRNLLTPITINAFYQTGFVLLLTLLKLKGCDINEMVQSPSFRRV